MSYLAIIIKEILDEIQCNGRKDIIFDENSENK